MKQAPDSSDVTYFNVRKREVALNFEDRVRPDGTMQGGGPLAPGTCTLPPCPHRLGLNCLKCYPKQWHLTNARMP